ncbi:hypothetical protein [Paenibacillus glacialis]|uniref:Lipoprotein n=1 Tax=Paenibacillus glacialis TaxID=494026 RepID=A0A168NY42_9BACL|nr:hypothetical protein [Paenibacillus glacialis]OAB46209.1 hypothetical protein PGLA_02165 [Paenibacillus glacialis]
MKKSLVLFMIFVLSVSLIACGKETKDKSLNDNVYKNEKLGFEFKIPERWGGNYQVKEIEKQETIPGETVEFLLSPKNAKDENREGLLSFYIIDKNVYAESEKEEGPSIGEYLGEKGDLVYLVGLPQSNPFEVDSEEGKLFDTMHMSFEDVKEAFTITK